MGMIMIRRSVLLVIAMGVCLLIFSSPLYAEASYVGIDGCRSCHKGQYASWKMSVHAKAIEILMPGKRKGAKKRANLDPEKDYSTDEKCLQCHTTGYGEPGGFKDMQSTPTLAGVTCEACHGAGSEYKVLHDQKPTFKKDENKAQGALYGSEDEKVCKSCHEHEDNIFTPEMDAKYAFDWKKRLEKRKAYHIKKKSQFKFSF
jgi:hypothetical protein